MSKQEKPTKWRRREHRGVKPDYSAFSGPAPEALVRAFRLRGWSQRETARRLGISEPYINMIVRGTRVPRPWLRELIEKEFSIPTDLWELEYG